MSIDLRPWMVSQIEKLRRDGMAPEQTLEAAEQLAEEARAAGMAVRIDECDLETITWYEVRIDPRARKKSPAVDATEARVPDGF